MTREFSHFARRLLRNERGLALTEFAFVLPIFITLCVAGTEMTNYITTKMRLSQIALQIADNAARMGTGSRLAAKTISETDINDLFAGAQLESGALNINTNGRVILSSLENNAAKTGAADQYKIGWQRCYGTKTTHASLYGTAGQAKEYMGTSTRRTGVLPDNATMFVEIYYIYTPIIKASWVPSMIANENGALVEIASMAVRDRRDLTSPPSNSAGATIATC
jgi:Flp pilus assembly protein TadG